MSLERFGQKQINLSGPTFFGWIWIDSVLHCPEQVTNETGHNPTNECWFHGVPAILDVATGSHQHLQQHFMPINFHVSLEIHSFIKEVVVIFELSQSLFQHWR